MKKLALLAMLLPIQSFASEDEDRARIAIAIAQSQSSHAWFTYSEARSLAERNSMPLVAFANCDPEEVPGAVVCGGSSCSHMASGPAIMVISRGFVTMQTEPGPMARGRIRGAIQALLAPPAQYQAVRMASRSSMGYSSGMMMRSSGYSMGGYSMMRSGYSMGGMRMGGGMRMMGRSSGGCSS